MTYFTPMPRWWVLLAAICLLSWGTPVSSKVCDPKADPTYVAAVVEYSPELGVTVENARQRFQENVAAFVGYAKEAKRLGAEIVVFPECGLATLELPRLPDDSPLVSLQVPSVGANPCLEEDVDYPQELRDLSCAARDASIYAAVNLPEEERCEGDEGDGAALPCNAGGSRFFNTDVAFNRQGAIVAKYRKYNLYGETGFVPTAEPTLEYFDSDFGVRFGLFTCFDLMFEEPAVTLVTDAGVTDVIFPTAWFSELPFLTAVQAQASWSRALDVNFLGAGYNLPQVGSTGSGLYAGRQGTVVASMERQRANKLLVGRLPNRRACSGGDSTKESKELTGRTVSLPLPRTPAVPRPGQDHNMELSIHGNPNKSGAKEAQAGNGINNFVEKVSNYVLQEVERVDFELKANFPHETTHHLCGDNFGQDLRPEELECEKNYIKSKIASPLAGSDSHIESLVNENEDLYLKTEDLNKYSTLLLTENQKRDENGVVDVCHGGFCCQFEVDMIISESAYRYNSDRPHRYQNNKMPSEDSFMELKDLEKKKPDVIVHSTYNNLATDQGVHEKYNDAEEEVSRYYYRLVAFNGRRSFDGIVDGGLQVCAIISCTDMTLDSCGKLHSGAVDLSLVTFRKVRIDGVFHKSHALPLPSTLDGALQPLPTDAFSLSVIPKGNDEEEIVMENSTPITFLTFGIYSRDFANDPKQDSTTG